MKKYLKNHIKFIEDELIKKDTDWSELLKLHRVQIGFLQHERLIHLLVTLFFVLMFFLTVFTGLLLTQFSWLIVSAILLVVLVFYIWHYYCLENGVQKLYQLDKKIVAKQKNN